MATIKDLLSTMIQKINENSTAITEGGSGGGGAFVVKLIVDNEAMTATCDKTNEEIFNMSSKGAVLLILEASIENDLSIKPFTLAFATNGEIGYECAFTCMSVTTSLSAPPTVPGITAIYLKPDGEALLGDTRYTLATS